MGISGFQWVEARDILLSILQCVQHHHHHRKHTESKTSIVPGLGNLDLHKLNINAVCSLALQITYRRKSQCAGLIFSYRTKPRKVKSLFCTFNIKCIVFIHIFPLICNSFTKLQLQSVKTIKQQTWLASQVSKETQLEWKQMEGVNEKIQLTFFLPVNVSQRKSPEIENETLI